jgi:hypothetical protein
MGNNMMAGRNTPLSVAPLVLRQRYIATNIAHTSLAGQSVLFLLLSFRLSQPIFINTVLLSSAIIIYLVRYTHFYYGLARVCYSCIALELCLFGGNG